MINSEQGLPDFKEYMELLKEDGGSARDFLVEINEMGYVIEELPGETDLRTLQPEVAIQLALIYWPIVYLCEYPDFGEYEQ